MPVSYDRHRRDRDERYGDYVSGGGRLIPRRPIIWLIVKLWRGFVWVVRSLAYGLAAMTHSTAGKVTLFAVVALMLLDASFGSDAVTIPIIGALAWPVLVVYGAHQYRRRLTWEDRVENAVYHVIPGHSRVELEVVWWRDRWNLGRWLGSWDFGFRLPIAVREADLIDLNEHLRERLPAAHGVSWLILWDLRSSVARAQIIPDMPDQLTRAELFDRMEAPEEAHKVGRDLIPVGVSVDGVEVVDVEQTPHWLGTGETGKGKSVAQLGIICHALQYPDDWLIYACDPKKVELGYLHGYPNVVTVATAHHGIVAAIAEVEAEMDARFDRMEAAGPGMNHIRKLDPSISRILLVVDELQQVTMPSGDKEADAPRDAARASLERITALGRAAGVHFYPSTQRPDVQLKILSGPLKHNLGGRLAVGKMDNTASMMALDTDAATQLPARPKGRAIWRGIEGEKRVQVAYTKESDLPAKKNG